MEVCTDLNVMCIGGSDVLPNQGSALICAVLNKSGNKRNEKEQKK